MVVRAGLTSYHPGRPDSAFTPVNFRIARDPGKTSKSIRSSAFLTCADYRILDFRLIILPSTANLSYLWMVDGFRILLRRIGPLSTSRTKRSYWLTRRIQLSPIGKVLVDLVRCTSTIWSAGGHEVRRPVFAAAGNHQNNGNQTPDAKAPA